MRGGLVCAAAAAAVFLRPLLLELRGFCGLCVCMIAVLVKTRTLTSSALGLAHSRAGTQWSAVKGPLLAKRKSFPVETLESPV